MELLDLALTVTLLYLLLSLFYVRCSVQFYAKALEKRHISQLKSPNSEKFHIIVPLFDEALIAVDAVQRFIEEYKNDDSVALYFVVHQEDLATTTSLTQAQELFNDRCQLIFNTGKSHSKASQLNAALKNIPSLSEQDILSIYDSDSIPNRIAQIHIAAILAADKTGEIAAFQQTPFYPINNSLAFSSRIANARAIYSLHYHLAQELPAYQAVNSRNFPDMAVHLTGHGEHLAFRYLHACRGFQEPSCDSSLGFAISYRNFRIVLVPVPDVGQTPSELREIWLQGIRWYRGCDLYWRELRHAGLSPRSIIQTIFTVWNNLRWFAFIPVMLFTVIFDIRSYSVKSFVLIFTILGVLFLRHIFLNEAYNTIAALSTPKVQAIRLRDWFARWFVPYLMIRVAWSFVPLGYYVLKLTRRKLIHSSTKKEHRNQ